MTLRRHHGLTGPVAAPSAAVAILSRLRAQTPDVAVEVPSFTPRPEAGAQAINWPQSLPRQAFRQALAAIGLALLVLAIVATIPAWPLITRGGSESGPDVALHSSVGVTGTADTRIPDLTAATFLGQIPFVQQERYLAVLTGSVAPTEQFLAGARQASLQRYLQQVNAQVSLPYLKDAAATREAVGRWAEAVRAQEAAAAARSAAPHATVWQPVPIAEGTALSSTVTFYACIGDGFCGHMANGQSPFPGAAACSTNMAMGTRFVINNDPSRQVFTCLDRGALSATWVDIWFYDISDGWAWQSIVGTHSTITIVP